ncbi:MAG: hypothetical protein IKA23_02525 [Akkermansia sp.]|nr:hypothetical protein [Akkermansia sp.]
MSLKKLPLPMLPIEYHILPQVKKTVGRCAAGARYVLWGCAVLALAELVLLPLRMPLAGILCGMVSGFLFALGVALVAVLVAWCHSVLLAGRGVVVTRWLVRIGAGLAPLLPLCWGYTLLSGGLLLYRQAELPLILGVIMLGAAVANIPRMAAAPWQLQVRVVALPLLLLLIYCTDVPGLLVFCAVFKLLAAWVAAAPLRLLADFAPRIISMPETE